jgi:hypothetical protein
LVRRPPPSSCLKKGANVRSSRDRRLLQQGLNSLIGFIPNIIGFLVILLIGYSRRQARQDRSQQDPREHRRRPRLHNSDAGKYVERVSPGSRPSHLIGTVAFWFVFLFAISAAVGALKIAALTAFIATVQGYLPNIIAAVLIFVIAAVVAGTLGVAVQKLMGDTPTGKLVGTIVPGLVLAIGLFMVLDQLNIAPQIVTITYAALLGMLALAGALAFGLGGRDVAAKMLADAYESGQRNKQQVKQDLQAGSSAPRPRPARPERPGRRRAHRRQHRRPRPLVPSHTKGPNTMPDINEVSAWRGEKLHGAGGEKLGTIEEIYLDEETEKPEWFAVKTGLFGSRVSFVPVAEASQAEGHVVVPYDKDQVKGAPHAEPDGALSQQEEAALYRHYGLQYSEAGSDTGLPAGGTGPRRRRSAASSATTPRAPRRTTR